MGLLSIFECVPRPKYLSEKNDLTAKKAVTFAYPESLTVSLRVTREDFFKAEKGGINVQQKSNADTSHAMWRDTVALYTTN